MCTFSVNHSNSYSSYLHLKDAFISQFRFCMVQVNCVRSLPRIQNKPRRSGIEPIAFITVSMCVLPALHNLFSESSAKQFKQQVQFILN